MNKALVEPRVLLVAYLSFFILAARTLSLESALIVILGAGAFLAGCRLADGLKIKRAGLKIGFPALEPLFAVSAAALILDLLHVGGIPLLDPSLHSRHLTAYLLLGFPIVPIASILLADYLEKKKGFLAQALVTLPTLMLTLLLGYRTDIVAAIVSFTIVYYLFGRISGKKLAALAASAIFAIVLLGFVKASAAGSVAGPVDVFAGRIEGTASIFDYIVLHSSPFGSLRGELHNAALSTLTYHLIPGPVIGPRALIAEFFGARDDVTFTATMLGPLYLDFGIFGVMLGLGILGFILSLAFRSIDADKRNAGVYAVLLAFSFVAIETGILDIVLFYFFGALFYLLVCLRAR